MGGVYLYVGSRFNSNIAPSKVRIVPILVNFALDNEEAYKLQSIKVVYADFALNTKRNSILLQFLLNLLSIYLKYSYLLLIKI